MIIRIIGEKEHPYSPIKCFVVSCFASVSCCSTLFLSNRSNRRACQRLPGQRDHLDYHPLHRTQKCNPMLRQQDDWEIWRFLSKSARKHTFFIPNSTAYGWLWKGHWSYCHHVLSFIYSLNICLVQARTSRQQKSLSPWLKVVESERQQLWPGRGREPLRTAQPSRTGPSLFLTTLLWSNPRLNQTPL